MTDELKLVLVFTWDDFCDWLRKKGAEVTECDQLDPTYVRNQFSAIQVWHKALVEDLASQYVVEFCDPRSGFIVFRYHGGLDDRRMKQAIFRELYPSLARDDRPAFLKKIMD